MIVTFTIATPMIHDAREQAVRLAQAQGYERITVLSVIRSGLDSWEVKLQLFRGM